MAVSAAADTPLLLADIGRVATLGRTAIADVPALAASVVLAAALAAASAGVDSNEAIRRQKEEGPNYRAITTKHRLPKRKPAFHLVAIRDIIDLGSCAGTTKDF